MGGSKHHEVDNSAHPSWAGCQENGAAPGSGGHGCTQPTLQKPPQAPSLETGGSHTPLSRQALREGGWALRARTGPGRRCSGALPGGDRWAPAGRGEGKDALFRPVPGLGEEQEETPRNAVGWSMERESQFLECFYSKEPREEMGSGGKT